MYQEIKSVRVWGRPLDNAIEQAVLCASHGNVVQSLLMADHHKGYSQPVGESWCMMVRFLLQV